MPKKRRAKARGFQAIQTPDRDYSVLPEGFQSQEGLMLFANICAAEAVVERGKKHPYLGVEFVGFAPGGEPILCVNEAYEAKVIAMMDEIYTRLCAEMLRVVEGKSHKKLIVI